ncbi:MAG: DMT family transporter [Anaerolineaceae bacterium]
MKLTHKQAIFSAILAAALYALSAPVAKLLLDSLSPAMMAALLYLGAGMGMLLLEMAARRDSAFHHRTKASLDLPLTKQDLPFVVGMIVLDILAPLLLLNGLKLTTSANASLLNNFEIVATSLIAFTFFKEKVSPRLWTSIILVTIASILLSIEDTGSLHFSIGSILVLLACICWGLENNFTRKLSDKNPMQIVVIKGFGSGLGALIIAALLNELHGDLGHVIGALLLGFAAYGLSIFFYVRAQRNLGAAKTSSFYATAPFFGVAFSFLLFRTPPTTLFVIALLIMMAGAYLSATDKT